MPKYRVLLSEVIDAFDSGDDRTQHWFDPSAGEVHTRIPELEDDEEEGEIGPDWVPVPRMSSRQGWELMERFALEQGDEDLREELLRALAGKGAFRRFDDVLARWPGDARERWFDFRHAENAAQARRWLEGLGLDLEIVEPERRAPPPGPTPAKAEVPEVGLIELLLLGAPDGKTELLDGRVPRVFRARNAADARRVFVRVARDIYRVSGLMWRKRFAEGKREIEVDRYRLELDGAHVYLDVAVEPGLRRRFSEG